MEFCFGVYQYIFKLKDFTDKNHSENITELYCENGTQFYICMT
jgi:hypothetical protein